MELYSIGEFARRIGRNPQTLRMWDRQGKLKPASVSVGGTRYYSSDQLGEILNQNPNNIKRATYGYCRVSRGLQHSDEILKKQVASVKEFMIAKGYSFTLLSDLAGGAAFDRPGFSALVAKILGGEIERVVVMRRDRIGYTGADLFFKICESNSVEVEIIDNSPEENYEELYEDIVPLITEYGFKLSGKEISEVRKLMAKIAGSDRIEE